MTPIVNTKTFFKLIGKAGSFSEVGGKHFFTYDGIRIKLDGDKAVVEFCRNGEALFSISECMGKGDVLRIEGLLGQIEIKLS